MSTKPCSRCEQEVPVELFPKRAASADGLNAACKACIKLYDDERSKLQHRKDRCNDYKQTDAGKASRAKSDAKYRASLSGTPRG